MRNPALIEPLWQVLRCYQQNDRSATPIHPALTEIEGLQAYPSLTAMPIENPAELGVSIITPAAISATVIRDAAALGKRCFHQLSQNARLDATSTPNQQKHRAPNWFRHLL